MGESGSLFHMVKLSARKSDLIHLFQVHKWHVKTFTGMIWNFEIFL